MDNPQPTSGASDASSETPKPVQHRSKRKLLVLLIALLLVAAAGIGYFVFFNKSDSKNIDTKNAANDNTSATSTNGSAATTDTTLHIVQFGSLDRDPHMVAYLAFPQNYQAIAGDNGSDSFRSLFGDTSGNFSYHGGDWQVGNPEDGNGNYWGRIGIMGIAPDWYGRNGFATYGGFNGDSYASSDQNTSINGYDFSSAKQKKDSLEKLASDTSSCAKDTAKGFSISGVFNVCYEPYLMKQAYAAYSPQIQFSGYASIKDVPYVLFGYVRIRSGLEGSSDEVLDKAGNDFKAGNVPAKTQKNIDAFLDAFRQSTVATK